MVVIGVVTTVVLLMLGVKAAVPLGFIAGLLEFIPTVGPILSAVPAVAMGFVDSPEKALAVIIAYVAIQLLENNLLIPLLMREGMDLPPALTMVAQALMTLVFGFLGLLCAVPVLAATMVAVKMLYVQDVVGEPVGSVRRTLDDDDRLRAGAAWRADVTRRSSRQVADRRPSRSFAASLASRASRARASDGSRRRSSTSTAFATSRRSG